MTNDLVKQLRAWGHLISLGYEVPAAGSVVEDAADEIERLRQEQNEAMGCAERLAVVLWEKWYRATAPNWKPLANDMIGLLTQIDNMTARLAPAQEKTDG